jgi:hypothetical protein
MLCEAEVYYSNPSNFNDPLECSPSVIVDVNLNQLESLYHRMVGEEDAQRKLNDFRCAWDEEGNSYGISDELYQERIADAIGGQLDSMIKKNQGVLSLAGQWNSPLMWSHYAEEHKGICIEYDVSLSVCDPPRMVDYEGDRGIFVSDIIRFVFEGAVAAKEKIEQKYFYMKASQWKYEEEWRYVQNRQGRFCAPFNITGIYFGMRCERSVASSIVRLMRESMPEINFYRISPNRNSFKLERSPIGTDELDGFFKPMTSAAMIFGTPIQHPDLN